MSSNPIGTTGNFGNLTADYERGRREYPPALMKSILDHIDHASDSLILDVGCGTGKATRLLAREARLVLGIDPDPQCLQTAREQGGINLAYRQASAEDLPFRDATFSAITTFSSFHWWCRIPGALASIHRVLQSGCPFFVVNKHDTGPFRQEARAIIAQYSPHELTDARQGYDPQQILQADSRWEVSCEDLQHEEQFTLPELLSQIRSLSAWNCIPEEKSAQATAALEAHFFTQLEDGIYRRPLLMRTVVARKP